MRLADESVFKLVHALVDQCIAAGFLSGKRQNFSVLALTSMKRRGVVGTKLFVLSLFSCSPDWTVRKQDLVAY